MHYTTFQTPWGWFGLAADDLGLCRTCLPALQRHAVTTGLLVGIHEAHFKEDLLKPLQERILAYFEGLMTDFSTDIGSGLARLTGFSSQVLDACHRIPYGRVMTYGQLATLLSRPGAARAVGNALGRNPLPLVIPCHRVIAANRGLGGFSATGGVALKARLLAHERACLRSMA